MDILFYIKEVIGVIVGIIIAISGLQGIIALLTYAVIGSLLAYLYVFKFLGLDEDVVETKDVLKEHFMNGFFPFLLTWIVLYNLINYWYKYKLRLFYFMNDYMEILKYAGIESDQ